MVAPRRRRARPPHAPASPLAPITAVNQVWTTDFKGEFRTGDGVYCYPLTLRDGFSRFVLRCDAFLGPTYGRDAPPVRTGVCRRTGLPERIRSDNGSPFASPGLGRLSRLQCLVDPPGDHARNGSRWAIRSKTDRMNSFTAVLKAETDAAAGAQLRRGNSSASTPTLPHSLQRQKNSR